MKQQTLAMAADQNAQYEQYRKPTRRDMFLATMETIVPWTELCSVIEPHYPKAGNGRPPVGAKVGEVLQANGLKVGTGTIVDATIIGAPSSTKNADKQRDPQMHQTRKGKQWYFMKLHIGVDSQTGLAHSAVVTAANVHDKHPLPDLLHGQEERVFGDCAYAAQQATIQAKAPRAQDFTNKTVRKGSVTEELERMVNRAKSRTRARVEHVFGVVKRLWGFNKVRYRGLAKNATRAFVTLAMANIYLARRPLLTQLRA